MCSEPRLPQFTRRMFIASGALALAAGPAQLAAALRSAAPGAGIRYGMVTYLWGKDIPLDDLLMACADAGLEGVELRTGHAHGVEPALDAAARRNIRARFSQSPVALVGLGSDERFDSPDSSRLAASIAATRAFLELSADVGGSGVKVKPDSFHQGVDRNTTIAQIGRALDELAPVAEKLGQELRLEVHGGCADPSIIARIMEYTESPSVRICWNSNPQDLRGKGLHAHFALLRPKFGRTMHVPVTANADYPLADLVDLVRRSDYRGYLLLETHDAPPVPLAPALRSERTRTLAFAEVRTWEPRPIHIAARTEADGFIDIRAGDHPLATLRFGAAERTPVLHPIHAPTGGMVVRGFPYTTDPKDETDHPHHRGLWFTHGDVDGHDFWHAPECEIRVRTHSIEGDTVRFDADWIAGGKPLAVESRTMRFVSRRDAYEIDLRIKLTPVAATLRLGDTKEGSVGIRLPSSMSVEGRHGRGRLENSDGLLDAACWGKPARTQIAEGPVEGRLVRIAFENRLHEAGQVVRWHARGYGLVAANPIGVRAFDGADAPDGARVITPESPLELHFTVTIGIGDA